MKYLNVDWVECTRYEVSVSAECSTAARESVQHMLRSDDFDVPELEKAIQISAIIEQLVEANRRAAAELKIIARRKADLRHAFHDTTADRVPLPVAIGRKPSTSAPYSKYPAKSSRASSRYRRSSSIGIYTNR